LFEWDLFNIRLFCPQMFPFRIRFRYLFFFHSILHRYHNFWTLPAYFSFITLWMNNDGDKCCLVLRNSRKNS
jgi:hypothetical protein